MRFKKIILAAAIALSAGTVAAPAVISAVPAYAGTGDQWAYEGGGAPWAYLNAWGGGPWVKVYTNAGTSNNDFTLVLNHAYNKYQLEFTGNGTSGLCIGDGLNESNNGYAYLVPCGFTGGAGWGSLLDLGSCASNVRCFIDDHWSSVQGRTDYLSPVQSYGNGSSFILNYPRVTPFNFYAPA